jgi:septum formation protein
MWIYLASQSPRRRELLKQIGVSYRFLSPTPEYIEEIYAKELDLNYVKRVCKLKSKYAFAQSKHLENAPILTADTIVSFDDKILVKPKSNEEAVRTLHLLSGNVHKVITCIGLMLEDEVYIDNISISEVKFKSLSEKEIEQYINSGEHMGKSGSYGIQGRAASFIEHINGSYSGVMGLPLFETSELLKKHAGWFE